MTRRVRAYIGLGANVGDPRRALAWAVAALDELAGVRVRAVSPLYRTAPVGVLDQPEFLNAVVALDAPVGLDPESGATALLVELKQLERESGRTHRRRWGPRELDLDLLLFGRARLAVVRPRAAVPLSAAIDASATGRLLEVPHASMAERLFVLAPLADLAPRLVPPGWRETVTTAARRAAATAGPDAAVRIGSWDAARGAWT